MNQKTIVNPEWVNAPYVGFKTPLKINPIYRNLGDATNMRNIIPREIEVDEDSEPAPAADCCALQQESCNAIKEQE